MVSAILVAFGLYFTWDAYRSLKAGHSNPQWGSRHSRIEASALFWATIAFELILAVTAFGLAVYAASN